MPSIMQEWADTINDEPLALVPMEVDELDESRFSLRDSARDLTAGLQVDFVDTIPNEFMEFFK